MDSLPRTLADKRVWVWFVLIVGLMGFSGARVINPVEGGSAYWFFPRDPFYYSGVSRVCGLEVVIGYPINGSTFYTNTLTFNVTISGNVSNLSCSYYENGAGPNSFDCVNATVTFAEGLVDLMVFVEDSSGCSAESHTFFNVELFGRREGGLPSFPWVALVILLTTLFIGFLNEGGNR